MMKFLRSFGIVAIVVAVIAILIAGSSVNQNPSDQIWNEAATVGDLDSKNYYIMYTDIMCPYCDFFSRAVMWNWDEFQAYLADNDILFEVRMTDYIYESSGSQYSRSAAEASYCAMKENKFWDFYHDALQALWDDYHSKGIGDSKTSPMITDMPSNYWQQIAHKTGLGEQFDQCLSNHETAEEIDKNTKRALQTAQGMPYFKFNKWTQAGFDNSWGWDYVKLYLDEGLKHK